MTDTRKMPDDFHKMPPPYWDDCGSIDQLIRNLEFVLPMLDALMEEIQKIDPLLDAWQEKREAQGESYDPEYDEFSEFYNDYERYVLAAGSYSDAAVLMAAITMESLINKFCVYNLHSDIVSPLEKLSPSDKLVIASAIVGHPGFKKHAAHEAAKKLSQWRNAFVHGHCVDANTKGILKNHLRKDAPHILDREAPQKIAVLKEMISRFLRVCNYISEMTTNPYVLKDEYVNLDRIRELLSEISAYHFTSQEYPYEIETREKK